MMRRDVLESVGGYDESYRYAQDYDLWLRLAERCEVANLPEYLYCWRKSGSSVTAAMRGEQEQSAARAKASALARGILPVPASDHVHGPVTACRGGAGMIDPRHPDFTDTPVAPGRPAMQIRSRRSRQPRLRVRS